ncbi:MAG: ABC-2 type transporter [candidate division TM6 bacterium GW2011_GWE2_41_16]|nr:MAG: ABC-2 type transporter [candidate division TM6 bacterium GW2011_GWE2_41_16]
MKESMYRIGAILYRHLFYFKKPFEIFHYWYWILIDIMIFGFLGKSISQTAVASNSTSVMQAHILFANLALLYGFLRANTTVGVALLRDLWDANFVALFSTPLRKTEWVIALAILAGICGVVSFSIGTFLVWLIFGFWVFSFGWTVLLALGLLLLAGMIVGFLMTALLLWLGKQANPLVWAASWLFVPISGVFYSIDVLPSVMRSIPAYNPLYHIFSFVRITATGVAGFWTQVGVAAALLGVYGVCVAFVLSRAFTSACKKGLTRLEVEM